MDNDKIVEIGKLQCLRQATVKDALERALEVAKGKNIKRIAILMRFGEATDDEILGFLVGKDNKGPYTNSLLVWDLEQMKMGLFQGYFEED